MDRGGERGTSQNNKVVKQWRCGRMRDLWRCVSQSQTYLRNFIQMDKTFMKIVCTTITLPPWSSLSRPSPPRNLHSRHHLRPDASRPEIFCDVSTFAASSPCDGGVYAASCTTMNRAWTPTNPIDDAISISTMPTLIPISIRATADAAPFSISFPRGIVVCHFCASCACFSIAAYFGSDCVHLGRHWSHRRNIYPIHSPAARR
mmetsp:Transcript_24195/g.58457  ORF Transcript_24195/g.58457 Transcript_24195/m.58457 type:complete len:203 (-) Transcript_24195:81-689(-)